MAKVKTLIPYVEGKLLKDVLDAAWTAKGLPEKPLAAEKKAPKKKEDETK